MNAAAKPRRTAWLVALVPLLAVQAVLMACAATEVVEVGRPAPAIASSKAAFPAAVSSAAASSAAASSADAAEPPLPEPGDWAPGRKS